MIADVFQKYPEVFAFQLSQPALTCSMLTIEILEQDVKYVQS